MKVAFVAFDFGEYCARLASGIADAKDTKVLMFLSQEEATPYLHLISGSVERRIFVKPRIRQFFQQLKMVFSLVTQIRAFDPDVIHLQLGHMWFNLLGLPLLRGIPLVLTVHDSLIHVGDAQTRRRPPSGSLIAPAIGHANEIGSRSPGKGTAGQKTWDSCRYRPRYSLCHCRVTLTPPSA